MNRTKFARVSRLLTAAAVALAFAACASFQPVASSGGGQVAGSYRTFSGTMISFLELRPDHSYLGSRNSHQCTDGELIGYWFETGTWCIRGNVLHLTRVTTNDPWPAIPEFLVIGNYKGDLILVPDSSVDKYLEKMPHRIYQWHFERVDGPLFEEIQAQPGATDNADDAQRFSAIR